MLKFVRKSSKGALASTTDTVSGDGGGVARQRDSSQPPPSVHLAGDASSYSQPVKLQMPNESVSYYWHWFCSNSKSVLFSCGLSFQIRRRSLGMLRGIGGNSGLPTRRQTPPCAPDDHRQQQQIDKQLGDMLNKAQSNRMDDQRTGGRSNFDLPDFLKFPTNGGGGGGGHDHCRLFSSLDESRPSSIAESSCVSVVTVGEVNEGSPLPSQSQPLVSGPSLAVSPPPIYASSVDSGNNAPKSSVTTPTGSWQIDFV